LFSSPFQRNGHWTGNYIGGSTTQVTEGSPNGSQSALLSSGSRSRRTLWPKGKDFLFSTWAFVVGQFYDIDLFFMKATTLVNPGETRSRDTQSPISPEVWSILDWAFLYIY
jgi:hypothetical protein